jgi:hypothetical protein
MTLRDLLDTGVTIWGHFIVWVLSQLSSRSSISLVASTHYGFWPATCVAVRSLGMLNDAREGCSCGGYLAPGGLFHVRPLARAMLA